MTENNRDYENILRPYNQFLERSISSDDRTLLNVGTEPSDDEATPANVGGNNGATSNGSVQEMAVKNDGAIGDVWIKNFIRSVNWAPKTRGFSIDGTTGRAEFTNVFISGEIEALTGKIGGWTIGANYIRDLAGVVGLSSAVTGGDDIRFWAGNTTMASAPFRVTEAGALVATSATITGAITASSGSIGSFTIGTYLYTGSKTAYNDANVGIHIGSDGIGIGNNVFTVSSAGVINAVSGTIGGCALATTSIGSTTFVSGPLGSGWNISNTGTAEFQNVTVRGIIRTSVFEKDTISAVNGMVLVSKADVLNSDMTALDASTLIITGETTFVNNEVIRIKDGTDDEWMLVTDASGAPTYVVTRDLASSYGADSNPIWTKGTAVVSMGVGIGTKTGYVLLDSSSANSPYIDIYGRNSNTYTDITLHARVGWLKGITDADVGLNTTDVWGIYTDNAYIKGVVVATTGYIGGTTGWTIVTGYIAKDTGTELTSAGMAPGDYPFYAGAQYANRATAPFRVSNAGVLNATGATISGTITATTGAIGGFDIGADYLRDVANSFGLASTVTVGDDVRFWAGDTFANRATAPLRILESGALIVSNIDIEGGAININDKAIIDSSGNATFTGASTLDILSTTIFETAARFGINAVTGSGAVSFGNQGVQITTGATATSSARLRWGGMADVMAPGVIFSVTFTGTTVHSTSSAFFGAGIPTITGSALTFTDDHIGFKVVAGNLYATQATGGAETSSAALTVVVNGNIFELIFKINSASVDYYWRKGNSAMSAVITLSTNQPTSNAYTQFCVTNLDVATASTYQLYAASLKR